MSYYFTIVGTRDNPLFELEFGTSKLGGDGTARFRDEAKYMNQFIIHAALDMVEEVQWANKDLYLKRVDTFQNNHIHTFLTGGNVKFMLLMNPDPQSATYSQYANSPPSRPNTASSRQNAGLLAANPTSQATEEAVKVFMGEVYENWVKCLMNPFYHANQPVTSPIFRSRVQAAAKKYL
ncbi:trafficking protein-like protein particle complex subunit 2 [Hortaea werneckii]|uniref:Trafficking protein particle complex subunit n=1 Tax=Hortaea werneckii TaxID=91943 RepID=A0A3M7C2Z4_HORWE|nr:trafficking protein-like protein particle complex subunit 2 [Hortaea werneckii]KAI6995120.1 trafficking protein-like protein particle complex subunit 2 [Hortaea werneckii]KAI7148866.1 trafficking protein-like protein particle complex subunit 2 [Hortaea werneckii]KAI7350332.1 trafficking protein-like protein particle complex subunit 2 [Hortaea werneckii]KAI7586083.1 trafficking protein-like protein particle complex subunit 2 [Hortaea werneckii]